ncbi:hypothetical protein BU25DRAFT_423348 [Macroventuria anomochaeta]|uniref:Uncharacterized protein n=1 Tax=Macroventuria anomochaeta TaxID=301207 RepID=A0ACB6RV15_9PLEO|nr:uncharacterized protein BU25DRAFT_423348 [Macroventuria anomochaeta]KAF2625255.1 hypothetical protein BU25DRAFT_423348 [Macroventuria anomochaeta]
MTFLELDENEDDSIDSEHSDDKRASSCLQCDGDLQADGSGNQNQEQDSEDDAYTVGEDSEDGYHTFATPSFFATSPEVEALQSAMQSYKPTHVEFGIIEGWLNECNRITVKDALKRIDTIARCHMLRCTERHRGDLEHVLSPLYLASAGLTNLAF